MYTFYQLRQIDGMAEAVTGIHLQNTRPNK
jgi:hypothetical protein